METKLIMSKLLSVMLSALLLLTGCGASEAAEASKTSEEPILASEAAKDMGIGISLGNTMEAYVSENCEKITYTWIPTKGNNTPSDYETCWGAPVTTSEMIKGMKDSGFDTLRIPVFWGNMMEDDGKWDINEQYLARVKEIVDMALDNDMYVVVNCHHFDEFIIRRHTDKECEEIFTHIWEQIANYFKDYSYKLIFEGYNEYLGGNRFDENGELKELSKADAYAMTNLLNQTFVDAVRSTGGNNSERILIASGYWTNIDNTTSSEFVMPTDTVTDRLMVSVHYVDNSMYWSNNIGNKAWRDYIDDQCAKLTKAFSEKNIPVFIGETTSNYPASNFASDAGMIESSECLSYLLNKIHDCGFVPVLWDANVFYSKYTCSIPDEDNAKVIENYGK